MGRRAAILTYHAVADSSRADDPLDLVVSPERFAEQMAFLHEHRRVVSLDDVVRGDVGAGPPPVAITFDDGYRSVLEHALPVLERHGFPATVFVPTRWVGRAAEWLDADDRPLPIMDADELRAVDRRGVAVESHGHGHVNLAEADFDTARADMVESRARLRELLGRDSRYFAYPFSHGSAEAQRAAAAAGFEAAFSYGAPGVRRYDWPRIPVTPYDGRRVFRAKTGGHYLEVWTSTPVRAARASTRPLRRLARRAGR
jgi:peptidoglycan/xylan/chitin deacetylase (PgdA/CDA1 family)